MDVFIISLALLGLAIVLSGPIAFIISIKNRSKLSDLEYQFGEKLILKKDSLQTDKPKVPAPPPVIPKPAVPAVMESLVEPEPVVEAKTVPAEPVKVIDKAVPTKPKDTSLELKIGTRWFLFAGIGTVFVAIAFFMKYAYDNFSIGPMGRVAVVTIIGVVALIVGEITRKKNYGVVAKAVTALGFAILYVADFAAYKFYGLITPGPAFVLAILITATAMLYAVSLNKVIIAILALLGGFLTPILVSTGENLPIPLFGYMLVLGTGAMFCGFYRKWRPINAVSFVGTFLLYTGWFEKFYRPAMHAGEGLPSQTSIALCGLVIFFALYLLMPILYELVKKVKAHEEDVLLVIANAAVTFYYLWTMLFEGHRTILSFCAIAMCMIYLFVMTMIARRNRQDIALQLSFLIISLAFLTIAIPLYLKMQAISIAWALEGVLLTAIGFKYRSLLTQVFGVIAIILSSANLIYHLPLHTGAFSIVLNPSFGSWIFLAAMVMVCQFLYRNNNDLKVDSRNLTASLLYTFSCGLGLAALLMEWIWHCDYNIIDAPNSLYFKGVVPIVAVITLLLMARPLRPKGLLCKISGSILAFCGLVYTVIVFTEVYRDAFAIFMNGNFIIALSTVIGLFAAGCLLKRSAGEDNHDAGFAKAFALAAIVSLWILLSEEVYLYWYWQHRMDETLSNWYHLAHMYMSITWAVYGLVLMAIGVLKKMPVLRYISLGLLAILLGKVFIVDTSQIKNVYRIAAFMATGITLVVISYLYQYLKNKGFFDIIQDKKEALQEQEN